MNNGYYNNYLSWRIDGSINEVNIKDVTTFEWKLDKIDLKEPNFLEACLDAAEKCKESAMKENKQIGLALSGGMDSQFIALCLLAVNVSFVAHIMKFEDNINKNDVNGAISFCQKYNIKYIIHTIDIKNFMAEEGLNFSLKYGINSPQYASHFWLALQMKDFFIIFGGGDCSNLKIMNENNNIKSVYSNFVEEISSISTALARLMIENAISGAAAFYRYTPNIKYALFTDELTLLWMKQVKSLPSSMSRYKHMKYLLYEKYFPNKMYGRKKLTGFELIEDFDYKIVRPKYIEITKKNIFTYPLTVEEEMSYYKYNNTNYIKFENG